MIRILLFSVMLVFITSVTLAQTFRGRVVDIENNSLPYAIVFWEGTQIGTTASDSGKFEIALPTDTSLLTYRIQISFGDNTEVYEIDDLFSGWTFTMSVRVELEVVMVYDEGRGAYISRLHPIKTEIINRDELHKAACCDLAGCFETQSSVQPQTTNILTNSKELRILGLSGVYNQVLVDGLPLINGLTYTYGISTLSGSIIENIWVVKGANSVLHGYEGMVGEITIYPREGQKAEPFTADFLMNSFSEKHFNVGVAHKKEKWNNYLAIHISQPGEKFDRDSDTFLDLPLIKRYSVYNKWRYRNENEDGWSTFIGARFTEEERMGGQTDFDPDIHKGTVLSYGQTIAFIQPEIFTKTGYRFNANSKLSFFASTVSHQQNSWFGVLHYNAEQLHSYANLQYELFFGKDKLHDLKTGISFRHLEVSENINFSSDTLHQTFDGTYSKLENIPGVFAESIFNLKKDTLTLITGIRADYHNTFGAFVTPRIMLRYLPKPNTDIRLSFGTGWRTVNLFSENINLLTSGRDVLFDETPRPEKSVNTGVNITQRFTIGSTDFTSTADFYHTRFSSQVFPDYDSNPHIALISNYTDLSVSNGFQAEIMAAVSRTLNVRFAYNFLDVYRKPAEEKIQLPFNARHRLLGVLSLHSAEPMWQVDINMHWYGEQRLPNSELLTDEFQQSATAKPYSLVSMQYTHTIRLFEFFVGCENVFDFRQYQPILSWQNPFSQNFDTSYAWGPTRGREFYAGLRFKIPVEE